MYILVLFLSTNFLHPQFADEIPLWKDVEKDSDNSENKSETTKNIFILSWYYYKNLLKEKQFYAFWDFLKLQIKFIFVISFSISSFYLSGHKSNDKCHIVFNI